MPLGPVWRYTVVPGTFSPAGHWRPAVAARLASLKTIIPSRKATRDFVAKESSDDETRSLLGRSPRGLSARQVEAVATKAELARMRAAVRATAIKDCRVNKRLSSDDVHDIQAKAPAWPLTGGIPVRGNDFAKAGVRAALAE